MKSKLLLLAAPIVLISSCETGSIDRALASLNSNPVSHSVYDTRLTATAGSRPFVVDTYGCSDSGDVRSETICKGSVERALVSRGYRISPSEDTLSDYNLINCRFDGSSRSAQDTVDEVQLGALLGGDYETEKKLKNYIVVDMTTTCEVEDGQTGRVFYTAVGASSTKREISGSQVPNSLELAGDGLYKSVQQAIGKLGPAARGVEAEVETVTAFGTDDGVISTREADFAEALANAKFIASQKAAASRVRVDESARLASGGVNEYSLEVSNASDSIVKDFEIIEDFGYVDGRYKIKIQATVQLSGGT